MNVTTRFSAQVFQQQHLPATKTKRKHDEDDLQIACVTWAGMNSSRHKILNLLIHVPNGGSRPKSEASRFKTMGVRRGVPDLMIPVANGQWKGFAAELKSARGVTSQEQRDWLLALQENGYCVAVVRTLDEFIKHVLVFLSGER